MPYRNDEEAVEARRIELERELADVKERAHEFAYLSGKQRELEKQIAEMKKRKVGYARARLPMLQQTKIASPCSASWEKMTGDDQVRFCDGCQKNVYDLSAMTSLEAEALLREKEGDLCARFFRRADGTIMTSDCSVGVRKKRVTRVASAALFFGGAAMAFSAYEKTHAVQTPHTMGEVATIQTNPFLQAPEMGTAAPPVFASPPPEKQPTYVMGVAAMPHPPSDATKATKNSSKKSVKNPSSKSE
ncbi:MAG: hypothetical protein ABI183_19245 [Polyangiaceae bacterium]